MSKPNILIFMVDEERYPVIYETPELVAWKKKNLKFQQEMIRHGIVFHNHYTNSTACAPARTTLHTGQYPSTHGVTQTDGLAISATDSEMTWLVPNTVPTLGNYFEAAGYQTILKGKWHVTDGSIRRNDGSEILTFDQEGNRLLDREAFYLEKDVLKDFAYHQWIGPEPHGQLPQNTAAAVPPPETGRDKVYQEQTIEILKQLECSPDPWLVFASFVNPHDITLFGLYTSSNPSYNFEVDPTLPDRLFCEEFEASHKESLDNKPYAQQYYRNHYKEFVQPIVDLNTYYRAYYTMQKLVDERMMNVWEVFKRSEDYQNTIVLFFSDHGDYLSSHGNQHQKWFNAYEECIHVPLIIRSPLFGDTHEDVSGLTSHVDILPTLLGLAHLNEEELRTELGNKFSLNLPLPGRDLSKYIFREKEFIQNVPIYFMTEDNPTSGPNQVSALGRPYQAVPEPCSVEAIVVIHKKQKWKLTQYYSTDSNFRAAPGAILNEMYNVSKDPMELCNLYGQKKYKKTQAYLTELLNGESFRNRQGS